MPADRRITRSLLGLVVLGLLAMPAGAVAKPFDNLVCGTWLMLVTVPPNPVLGNTQPVVMPEYATFGIDGTSLHVASTPGFPFPVDDSVIFALVTSGSGNWENDGRRLVATDWRFATDPATGDFLGFFKISIQVEASGRDRLQGEYFLEILDPQLNRIRFGGQEFTLRGAATGTRIAVERMPRR